MKESAPDDKISWENIVYIADFLLHSGEKHLSLLGGEPTLHPDFVDIVLYFIERNFHITVFTSGIVSSNQLVETDRHLTKIPYDRLNFVCNLNNPEQTPSTQSENDRIRKFLSIMGPWTGPGFNIYRTDFDLEFIFSLINQFGMKRQLRLGIASPTAENENIFISPQQMRSIINRLFSFKDLFDSFQIRLGFDCGFPLCAVSDEVLGWLYRGSEKIYFGCSPAIDITPNMEVYACFPLSHFHRRSLLEFNSMRDITEYYAHLHNIIRQEVPGIYNQCDGCFELGRGVCSGGGICHLMNNFIHEAPVRLPEIESEFTKPGMSL